MKKMFLLTLFFSVTNLFGQGGNPNELPNLTVPSPQAFAFTKYGNVATNETRVTKNILVVDSATIIKPKFKESAKGNI